MTESSFVRTAVGFMLVTALAPRGAPTASPQTPSAVRPAISPAMRFEAQEIRRDFGVGYAVAIADINGDKRPDVLALSGTQLVWFEHPSWTQHVLLDGQTPKDNVTMAPHDIDGDGRMDVAVGAAWNPRDTNGGGTLHWTRQPAAEFGTAGVGVGLVRRTAPSQPGRRTSPAATSWVIGGAWPLFDIGSEPTLHRIRWANVDGKGGPELVVGPLHGRGTSPPEWNGAGARLLVFKAPAEPHRDRWEPEVADDSLHILHNFVPVRFDKGDRDDLLTASREGVHRLTRGDNGTWTRTKLGEGAPGEIRLGQVGGRRVLATIEPWHGHSVVLFLEPEARAGQAQPDVPPLWSRVVIDDQLAGGHALAWADFDGDGDDELAAGWRDKTGGVVVYDLTRDGIVRAKTPVDLEKMATEDLVAADLDGDGRPEIIASGRRTANVTIYWNRTPSP